jgi:salicylate hydroxylase
VDSPDRAVAIVGAGLSGLTLAACLHRAGRGATVFEQAPALAEVGAGIQLAPNATRLLHRLGLADHLRAVAVQPAAIEMRRYDDNSVLGRTALGRDCEERYGAPYYTLHRADLHRGLVGLLPPDALRLGLRCTGLSEKRELAQLRFDTGDTADAAVVAGADGIHSVVRDTLATDRPRFSGQTILRGLVPAQRVPYLLDEPKVVLWLGPRQHFVCYPVAGGRLVSFGATTPAGDWTAESWSAPGSLVELTSAYQGWHPEVTDVIAAAGTVSRWALHDRDPLHRWSTGRVTVLGDAAHPMLPFLAQGANQAIEDAVTLAACLAATGTAEPATALARYEDLRQARTARVQEISRGNATTLHLSDGGQQRERDAALRETQRLEQQQWLYGHDAAEI